MAADAHSPEEDICLIDLEAATAYVAGMDDIDDPRDERDETELEVPLDQLSADALLGVIDDFVLREGTDYGATEYTLEQKRKHVLEQLRSGTILMREG
jgi:uncharacterized protein YheU (UPF0270 family)